MKKNLVLAVAAAVMLAHGPTAATRDGEVRVLCSNGIKRAMETLRPSAEGAIGQPIAIQFGASAVIRRSIDAGEPFDVAILTPQVIGALVKAGKIASGTEMTVARVNLGVGIRAGGPRADISTPEAIRRRLLAARSVTYSREGASNAAILKMLQGLGIADEIKGQTVLQTVSGRPAESVSEGQNEIVFAPVSEILMVRGVEVLGLFPPQFQQPVVMTAAVSAKTTRAIAANALIAFLTSAAAAQAIKDSGMEPAANQGR